MPANRPPWDPRPDVLLSTAEDDRDDGGGEALLAAVKLSQTGPGLLSEEQSGDELYSQPPPGPHGSAAGDEKSLPSKSQDASTGPAVAWGGQCGEKIYANRDPRTNATSAPDDDELPPSDPEESTHYDHAKGERIYIFNKDLPPTEDAPIYAARPRPSPDARVQDIAVHPHGGVDLEQPLLGDEDTDSEDPLPPSEDGTLECFVEGCQHLVIDGYPTCCRTCWASGGVKHGKEYMEIERLKHKRKLEEEAKEVERCS